MAMDSYVAWDASPTSTTPKTPFGFGVLSGSGKAGAAPEQVEYVGRKGGLRGKLIELDGSVEFEPDQAAAVLALALRSAGALSTFSVGIGDGTAVDLFHTCTVNTLNFNQGVDTTLKSKLDWWALTKATDGATQTLSAVTGTPWEYHHAVITVAGLSLWTQSFDLTVNNNLERGSDLDGATAGSKRFYKRIRTGHETIELSVNTEKKFTTETQGHLADALLTNLAFSAVYTNGAKSLTLSLANLACGLAPVPASVGASPLAYDYTFVSAPSAGGLASALTCTIA